MSDKSDNPAKLYPKGHFVSLWMGLGMAFFTVIGITISFLTENFSLMGIGLGAGVGVGLAVGQGVENKYEKEGKIRPLNEAEQRNRRIMVYVGLALLLIGVIFFYVAYKKL
ncbi:hypothetical protein ACFLT1_07895 [Bacteroidota bacterium]